MKAVLVISTRDNVATALEPLEAGRHVSIDGREIVVREAVGAGHKIAILPIAAGAEVIKYGSAIGIASAEIDQGAHVHTHNVASTRGRGDLMAAATRIRAIPDPTDPTHQTDPPVRLAEPTDERQRVDLADRRARTGAENLVSQLLGYVRPDGRIGVRNYVLVVPTVICSSVVCERIAAAHPAAIVALPHLAGCGQLGPDMYLTHETLAAYCQHPNVGAVLVVALGCEQVMAQELAISAKRAGKPAEIVSIQGEGGTPRAIAVGTRIAERLAAQITLESRQPCDASSLILSLKCGGSDYTSGLASNPTLGRVADRLIASGGAAVLGEVAEIMGAEHLLAARARVPEVGARLLRLIDRVESETRALGLDIRGTQPSPGNIRGGLTTIEEKSLGAAHKGGERSTLEDVVRYSGRITKKGLTVMDTPGLDVESVTGMVGGGAQVVVFTTGLGTPTGNPIAPVIKITGNARTARQMADNIDLDVSGVMNDTETLDAAADRLFDQVLAVCSGQLTAAERLGHREFAIHRRNPTI